MLITITEVISCNYVQRAIKKIRNIKDTRVEFIYCWKAGNLHCWSHGKFLYQFANASLFISAKNISLTLAVIG